jgi:hypothetical protein
VTKLTEAERQMDRFDAMITEYLRSSKRSINYLCEKTSCSPSSLWRYRTKVEAFQKMPLQVLMLCFRYANASNEEIREILGLPTGKENKFYTPGWNYEN